MASAKSAKSTKAAKAAQAEAGGLASLQRKGLWWALLCVPAAFLVVAPVILALVYNSQVRRQALGKGGEEARVRKHMWLSLALSALVTALWVVDYVSKGDDTMGLSTVFAYVSAPSLASVVYILALSGFVGLRVKQNSTSAIWVVVAAAVVAGLGSSSAYDYYRYSLGRNGGSQPAVAPASASESPSQLITTNP